MGEQLGHTAKVIKGNNSDFFSKMQTDTVNVYT